MLSFGGGGGGRVAAASTNAGYYRAASGEPGVKDGLAAAPAAAGSLFAFHARAEPVDWKRLASVDIDAIARSMDIRALQDNIKNVACCRIESEIDARTVDPNFVKLFKLSQLIVEYLLHCQDILADTIVTLEDALKKAELDHEETRRLVGKLEADVSAAKRESHRRKKMLAQQQLLLDAGTGNYHKCWQCPKAFLNATFLQNHIQRRHSLQAAVAAGVSGSRSGDDGGPPAGGPAVAQQPPQLVPVTVATLQAEVGDIRQQLELSQAQATEERRSLRAALAKEQAESERRERELRDSADAARKERDAAHRAELQRVQDMFMNELRETNEKYRASQQALSELRLQFTATLGTLSDDVDAAAVVKENEKLQRERDALAKLRDELDKQVVTAVQAAELKLSQQEAQWKDKMAEVVRRHELELAEMQMRSSGGGGKERSRGEAPMQAGVEQQQLIVALRKQVADLESQGREQRQQLQRKDAEIEALVQRPPPIAPRAKEERGWPSSISSYEESALQPKTKMLQFKEDVRDGNGADIGISAKVGSRSSGGSVLRQNGSVGSNGVGSSRSSAERDEEDMEEDEDSGDDDEEEEDDDGGTDTVRPGQSGSMLSDEGSHLSPTLDRTADSAAGTLDANSSLTASAADGRRLREAALSDPWRISQMRQDLQQLLDRELSQRDINPKSLTLPRKQFDDKMTRLALERQQKAKKFASFTQVRKEAEKLVNQLAAERIRIARQASEPNSSSREGTLLATASRASNGNNSNANNNGSRTPRDLQAVGTLSSFGTASSQWMTSTADSTTMRASDDGGNNTTAELTGDSLQLGSFRRQVEDVLRSEQESTPDAELHQKLSFSQQQQQQLLLQQQQQQQQLLLQQKQQQQLQRRPPPSASSTVTAAEAVVSWAPPVPSRSAEAVVPTRAAAGGPHALQTGGGDDEPWDSDEASDLEEVRPVGVTPSTIVSVPVGRTTPQTQGGGQTVARLAASIEAQLASRSDASKPVNGVDILATLQSGLYAGSPVTPEIPQLNDDSDDSDYSLTSNDDDNAAAVAGSKSGARNQRSTGGSEVATNTFSTSMWSGGTASSLKASPHGGAVSLGASPAGAAAASASWAGRTSGPASIASDAGSFTTVTGASVSGHDRRRESVPSDSDDDISDL